jgi:hypothetical protein
MALPGTCACLPRRAEVAEVRALLSTRDQELGAALERLRALEAPREPAPDALQRDSERVSAETPQQQLSERERPWWRGW